MSVSLTARPLAPRVAQSCHDAGVRQLHANLLGECRARITIEGHHRAIHLTSQETFRENSLLYPKE